MLSAEDLLAGGSLELLIDVPTELLDPASKHSDRQVLIKPLCIKDFQIINRAAKENDDLMAVLMVQKALIEPSLSVIQVNTLPIGLLQYLLQKVNDISGVNATEQEIDNAIEAPLSKAAFILAQQFGWTPEQVGAMTLGQILVNLKLCEQHKSNEIQGVDSKNFVSEVAHER